jgi:hypothetical protein
MGIGGAVQCSGALLSALALVSGQWSVVGGSNTFLPSAKTKDQKQMGMLKSMGLTFYLSSKQARASPM